MEKLNLQNQKNNFKVIVGLGNPGYKYRLTRHNIGYMFVDYLAQLSSLTFQSDNEDYFFAKGQLNESFFLLVKPTRFINNSGFTLKQLYDQYSVTITDTLVVYDDIHLPLGKFKVSLSSGDGGHNGIRSIITQFNTILFPKIRIGINNNFSGSNFSGYVLSEFSTDELKSVVDIFYICKSLTAEFVTGGTKKLMDLNSNLYNKKKTNTSEREGI